MNLSPAEFHELVDKIATAVAAKLAARPKLVDRYDLATMIGVSTPTVERLQRDGKIPCVRINRRVLYDVDAVLDSLSANEKTPRE